MRYSIDAVWWLDTRFKEYLVETCPFPETLPHLAWSAVREYFLDTIDSGTFIYFFTRHDSDLMPLAYCIISNW